MDGEYPIAPDHLNTLTGPQDSFVFAFEWGDGVAWSDSATLRFVSEDGSELHDFAKSDGEPAGKLVAFTFFDAQPGVRYRGLIVDGDYTVELFGPALLCAVQHANDPTAYLPLPAGPEDFSETHAAPVFDFAEAHDEAPVFDFAEAHDEAPAFEFAEADDGAPLAARDTCDVHDALDRENEPAGTPARDV